MWVCAGCWYSLTLWREERREPVSCRKSISDLTPRFSSTFEFLAKLFPGCDKQHVPGEKPGAVWGGAAEGMAAAPSQVALAASLHSLPGSSTHTHPGLPQPWFYTFMDMGQSLRRLRGKGRWPVEAMDLETMTGRDLSICF